MRRTCQFEQTDDLLMVLHAGKPERRPVPAIGFVHIYSVGKQHLGNLSVSVECGANQRGVLILVGFIAISPVL